MRESTSPGAAARPRSPMAWRLAEHSPRPLAATEGSEHIVRYANPAFCRLVGQDRPRLAGRPVDHALPKSDRAILASLLDRVSDGGTAAEVVGQIRQASGGETACWTYLAWPVFDDRDELVGAALQVSDTTGALAVPRSSERTEEVLRAANEQLLIAGIREQELAELAANAQHALYHAQRIEGIGALAGGIAHDFNNLLTAILGYTQLSADTLPPDDPVQKHLQTVKGAGERAARLTSQLLAFARKQVIHHRVVDVNALVVETHSMLDRLLGADVACSLGLRADPAWVMVDPGQFDQVLVNLAVNARDAMPSGGTLTIETANTRLGPEYCSQVDGLRPGEYVALVVADTGTGMPPDVQERLFEPFFSTKGQGKGTGLGLATCWGIVKQSSGHIQVESELGAGTRVLVYLPCAEEPDTEEPHEVPPAPPPSIDRAPQAAQTVLVVEDEAAVRDIVVRTLRLHGFVVIEAQDGKEALKVLRRHVGEVDLVVTDMLMPVMGGRELSERLHKTDPRMRVLLVSGCTGDEAVRQSTLTPGTAFLPKPFTPDGLVSKVRELLGGARGHDLT